MAIKIVNGKAVVVQDEQQASKPSNSSQSYIPKPSTNSQLFTKKDPEIALRTAFDIFKGFIPGAEDISRTFDKNLAPKERMVSAIQTTNPFLQMGKFGANLLRGAAGVIPRVALSASSAFGGPSTSAETYGKIPIAGPIIEKILGPQQAYQNTYGQLRQAGAGKVTSAGISAIQPIFDLLLGKSVAKNGPTLGLLNFKKGEAPKADIVPPIETAQKTQPKPPGYYGELFRRSETAPRTETVVPRPQGFYGKEYAMKGEPMKTEAPSTEGLSPDQKLGIEALNRKRQAEIPKPQEPVIPKPDIKTNKAEVKTTELLDQLLRPEKKQGKLQAAVEKLKELNPWRFESGKLESYGKEGKQLVTLGRRVNAQAITTAGDLRKVNESLGIPNLKQNELTNLRAVMEGREAPVNDTVAQIVPQLREVMNKYGSETGVNIVENYFPRRLNEAGRKFYQLPENKEQLIQTIMEGNGGDRADAIARIDQGIRRGSFEFERLLPEVPDKFRLDPLEEIYRWENEIARRKGIIQEFGAKDEKVNDLISKIGIGDKFESQIKKEAKTYVDRVAGRISNETRLDPVYNFLKGSMVVSKINPLTTVGNELQGHISSYLDYGIKGLADSTFGRNGDKLVKDLGLDNLRGKIGDEVSADSFATKWLKAIGMEGSEIRGFKRTATSSYSAIQDAFEALKKDPKNVEAKRLLNEHAMFPDDADLARALMSGKIPEEELKIGIVEGVRRKMFFSSPGERPAWANSGAGSAAYTFHNYILNQMQLLSRAPLHRQLAYLMVIAPITGLPTMLLRRMIQGKPLPEDPMDWYAQTSSAGPGTPTDLYQSLAINPTSFITGSFSPIIDLITSKNKLKTAFKHFFPMGNILQNRVFPPKN